MNGKTVMAEKGGVFSYYLPANLYMGACVYLCDTDRVTVVKVIAAT